VVLPAVPARPRPLTPAEPQLTGAIELLESRGLSMIERRVLDTQVPAIARCGDFAFGGRSVQVGMTVEGSGAVRLVEHGADLVDQCVADVMRRTRFGVALPRVFQMTWQVPDSLRPSLQATVQVAHGSSSGVQDALDKSATRARSCLKRGAGLDRASMFTLGWRLSPDSEDLVTVVKAEAGTGFSATDLQCVRRSLSSARLASPSRARGLGVARVTVSVPAQPGHRPVKAGTKTGYEIAVIAATEGVEVGRTRSIYEVGQIPAMRLRATPSLADPGSTVDVELFRGPSFTGSLPKELALMNGSRQVQHVELEENKATFTIPDDVNGFLHVDYAGARTVVYVRPRNSLTVLLETDASSYRPGAEATLSVTTRSGGKPSPAGVGLVGVDLALSQLAPLLGPQDYGRVTVRATSERPAFGAFDPRALTLGQVRGENAAKAAVLRISQLPMDPAGDEPVGAQSHVAPDTVGDLTQSFYGVLGRLVEKVRTWEREAPEGETMQPARMVELWNKALAEAVADGAPSTDAFGRPLRLGILPSDLLAQVDPRQVVSDGTRLPEDVVSWTRFVAEEVK